jgi:pimeloyl-ACP methyl ester carboxylesterase
MKHLLRLGLAAALVAAPARAEDAAGDWSGLLMGRLHVRLHIDKAADGGLTGEMISLDQGNARFVLSDVASDGAKLSFDAPAVKGRYAAEWNATQKAWVGKWSQGADIPLSFQRTTAADMAAPKRPQEEAILAGPRPYRQAEVSFAGGAPDVQLAGTLSIPNGKGPFPAVVLIAGSGPQNRDEDVMGHKVFLVLADALNRAGLAVLRYDKRGIGASSGHADTATTADYAADARAALDWLVAQPGIDAAHIGLIGHSEGGLIAPQVAAADTKARFLVLLAGPGVRGDKLLSLQSAAIGRAAGLSEAQLAAAEKINTAIYTAVLDAATPEAAKTNVAAALQPLIDAGQMPADRSQAIIAQMTSPWMFSFIHSDPAPALRQVRVPVLAINGGLDLQVPAAENLPAIKAALADDADVTTLELPDLNHLMQKATTGAPDEYARIEETIDPSALTAITDWVKAHIR